MAIAARISINLGPPEPWGHPPAGSSGFKRLILVLHQDGIGGIELCRWNDATHHDDVAAKLPRAWHQSQTGSALTWTGLTDGWNVLAGWLIVKWLNYGLWYLVDITIMGFVIWLLVQFHHLEKYDFVSWDDDIPNIWKYVPNHQPEIGLTILKNDGVRQWEGLSHIWNGK